jgi:arylsulfatase A-like enzyme
MRFSLLLLLAGCQASGPAAKRGPNVVLIFADDLGYADLGAFGAKGYRTPRLDRLAAEGIRLTDFSVPQAVCSASRAALLTGCYPNRVGILGALGPSSRIGLHPDELTLAEALKTRGYATAAYGKWHLGHRPPHLPARHGFDEWFGLPYSNDMWPRHPENPKAFPDLPLMEGEKVLELNPDQARLSDAYARRAEAFIEANQERPFFVYLAFSMPHVPLFASKDFLGTTPRGLYGDVLEELDASVGRVLGALDRLGLSKDTLVVFTSDNGPWLSYGEHAGSAEPLREGKGTAFEGGVRVPCVLRWPGGLPAGVERTGPAMSIDLYPTILSAAGAAPPAKAIDGLDLGPMLRGGPSPRSEAWYHWGRELHAVRSGPLKLHLPHEYRSLDGRPGGRDGLPAKYAQKRIELSLFDLAADPGETRDLASERPDDVRRLMEVVERARAELGDAALKRDGRGVRPPGRG